MSTTSASDQPLNDEFYRELFNFYDQQNTGYITVEKFLEISLSNMSDADRAANELKIQTIKKFLDPNETGQIDFEQFVIGIKKFTSDQAEANEEGNVEKQETEEETTSHPHQSNDFNNSNDEMTDWNDLKHLSEMSSKPSLFDSSGFIEFEGKSNESSLTYSNDTYNEYDTNSSRHSKKSVSLSHSSPKTDTSITNKINSNLLDFDMFDSVNSNNNSKSSTDSILNSNSDDYTSKNAEDDDPFGFGIDSLELHRKSLINTSNIKDGTEFNSTNRRANELYNTSITDNKLLSSFDDLSNEKDYFETDEKNYDELKEEQIIEKLEEKVNFLTFQNESLVNEKNELSCTANKYCTENSSLYEKIREFEEVNLEQDKRIRFLMDEQTRLTESLNKANIALREDTEAHLIQKSNLEKALSDYKEENVRYLKIISEINKNIEKHDKKLSEETEKYHALEKSFQIVIKEKEQLKKESEVLIANHFEKIQSLTKALNETRATLDLLNQKQRSNTMVDQITTNTRMKEFEGEIERLKLENLKLNGTIEELNAQLMAESGRVLMSSSMNKSDSFAAELGTVTNEKGEDNDLMEKYKLEKENNKRLQDYIEDIISTIMDHNPEILEINMNNKRKKANATSKR